MRHQIVPHEIQFWRAKNKALAWNEGTYVKSYKKIPKYNDLLKLTYPRTIIESGI